jgi:beta-glucosidase
MISLEPEGSERVIVTLSEAELGFYKNDGTWTVENGKFKIYVGGSSATSLHSEIQYQKNK